jgi:hypothetical protein
MLMNSLPSKTVKPTGLVLPALDVMTFQELSPRRRAVTEPDFWPMMPSSALKNTLPLNTVKFTGLDD